MKVVALKRPSLISEADKRLILDSIEELKQDISEDRIDQFAYVAFTSDGTCIYGYCGADVEPYRLAGALTAQAQELLFAYHVAESIE